MKKITLALILVGLSVSLGYSFGIDKKKPQVEVSYPEKISKRPTLRVALVSDSHSENENLKKALRQAQGEGINLVVGLGDWTQVGTIEELIVAKEVLDNVGIPYFVTAGDHDLWDSRNQGKEPLANFREIFGSPSHVFEREGVQFVILDNSDIYKGISGEDWEMLENILSGGRNLSAIKKRSASANLSLEPNNSPRSSLPSSLALWRASRLRSLPRAQLRGHVFDWQQAYALAAAPDVVNLTFVFAHKTPFHPESKHVMGENSNQVVKQAQEFLDLLVKAKVEGFFAGDLHFFAQFKDPSQTVKMTTVGAAAKERNFQGPRFAILTVWEDYSWEVRDVEIR